MIPTIGPNFPATGASVVENSSARIGEGWLMAHVLVKLAR